MGYGVLALQALGEPYLAQAILAGLYSAIVLPMAVLALGSRTATMYAPRSVVALLIGSIVAQTIAASAAARGGALPAETMFALVLFLIVVAGLSPPTRTWSATCCPRTRSTPSPWTTRPSRSTCCRIWAVS
jgi:hypothetical protein